MHSIYSLRNKGGTPGSRGGWGVVYRDPPLSLLYCKKNNSKNFFIKKNSYLSFAFDSCLHVFFDYLQEALVQCTGVFCYICCSMFTWSTDWVGDPGISTRDSFLYGSMEKSFYFCVWHT